MKKSERIKVLEERIAILEQQDQIRERNFNNLTVDEKHIINKFFTVSADKSIEHLDFLRKENEFLTFLKDEQTKLCSTNYYESQHLLQRIINKYEL